VAFKLKKNMAESAVQQTNETSNSTGNPSGEASERILDNTDSKDDKSADDMTKEKEINIKEATESEKCTGDALEESEKHEDSESLSRDDKSVSGNVKNPISREDLKEALKKFGNVRVIIIHSSFRIFLLFL
jgi:lupus La protein